jgi:HEAT repeat protein
MEQRKCRAKRSNGEPCKRWAIVGGSVCMTHGGSAPQVRKAAEERLRALIDPAIDAIEKRISDDENPAVQLSAAKDLLDRTGFKPKEVVEQTITSFEGADLSVLSADELETLTAIARKLAESKHGEQDPDEG